MKEEESGKWVEAARVRRTWMLSPGTEAEQGDKVGTDGKKSTVFGGRSLLLKRETLSKQPGR